MARRILGRDIARWDPFREFSAIQDRMTRLFQDVFGDTFSTETQAVGLVEFAPSADVYEDDNHVELKLEVPGIEEKDLDISIQDNVLNVRGERKLEKGEKEENFLRQERSYGKFYRSFTLPNSVDTEHVNANYVNGVLHIRLGKRAEAKPRQINVNFGQKVLQGETKAAA